MATMHLLENPDPRIGGALLTFPSGFAIEVSWRRTRAVLDVGKMARDVAAQALDALMSSGRVQDADGTNWPSIVAGLGALIREWDSRLVAAGGGGGGAPAVGEALTPSTSTVH